MFPVKLQVLWEGQDVWSLWLSMTDPGCPVLGWSFLSESLGWRNEESWDSATPPASSFLLPAPSWQPSLCPHSAQDGAELAEVTLLLLGPSLANFPPVQPLTACRWQWESVGSSGSLLGDLEHVSFFAFCALILHVYPRVRPIPHRGN